MTGGYGAALRVLRAGDRRYQPPREWLTPVVREGLSGYDVTQPCGPGAVDARRRHLAQGRVCDVCGVPEGPPFVAGAA